MYGISMNVRLSATLFIKSRTIFERYSSSSAFRYLGFFWNSGKIQKEFNQTNITVLFVTLEHNTKFIAVSEELLTRVFYGLFVWG